MRSVEVARRLNLRCLSVLARVAATDNPVSDLEVLTRHHELWDCFDARACERAARLPIVLLDCHFSEVSWWNRVAMEGYASPGNPRRAACFAKDDAAPLLREILVEARTIAISEPRAASLVMGAPADVVATVAALTSTNIDQLSLACAPELRPRWENNLVFWRNLITASIGNCDEALSEVSFYVLQLLGSMLIQPNLSYAEHRRRPKLR